MTARSWHACRCRYCKRLLWRGTTTVDSCAALSCRNLLTRLPRPSHVRCQSALLVNHGPRPAGTALLGSDARTAQWHGDLAARACQPAPEPAALLRVQALLAQASPPPAPLHERCDLSPEREIPPEHESAATLTARPARHARVSGGAWLPAPPGSTCRRALWRVCLGEVGPLART